MTRRSALMLAVLAVLAWTAVAAAVIAAEDKPAGYIGVRLSTSPDGHIQVDEVMKDGPADKAGLKAGDIIKKLGGKEVKDAQAFATQVQATKPGDKITLTVSRGGKDMEIMVTVGKKPAGGS